MDVRRELFTKDELPRVPRRPHVRHERFGPTELMASAIDAVDASKEEAEFVYVPGWREAGGELGDMEA